MKTKHTPGPWSICGLSCSLITDKNAYIVAEIPALKAQSEIMDQETRQANAKLIASAPELLNALELAQATIERLHRHAPGSANGTLDVIKAAISKATS